MAQYPSDVRIGVNGMCGQVRQVGLEPVTMMLTNNIITVNVTTYFICEWFIALSNITICT